ncbi:LOW QUALITY PROTEIN: hypothetical protein BRADI_4g31198v3 [Brachypodium distachyon]|uniref:Uncharacterized protein n=1 Tax=Brachypodium distachyon TaxID=15368 RepID=A0A2K2CRK6_BRADI|nr:LOW QUALITY PROTEIN: hypothetical protein BRADI_4g31198v3 [Brachypodium distachyon]
MGLSRFGVLRSITADTSLLRAGSCFLRPGTAHASLLSNGTPPHPPRLRQFGFAFTDVCPLSPLASFPDPPLLPSFGPSPTLPEPPRPCRRLLPSACRAVAAHLAQPTLLFSPCAADASSPPPAAPPPARAPLALPPAFPSAGSGVPRPPPPPRAPPRTFTDPRRLGLAVSVPPPRAPPWPPPAPD